MERYVATGGGNVRRPTGHAMYRLRVGDWRVRFTRRTETRARDEAAIEVVEVLRVRHRREAYDDL
jgi:hypothetical protein